MPRRRPPDPSVPRRLTPGEVADRWRCSVTTVMREIAERRLPHFRIGAGSGRLVRVDLAELERNEKLTRVTLEEAVERTLRARGAS